MVRPKSQSYEITIYFNMPTTLQIWYVAIDVNDQIVAMFLIKDHCERYCSAMEEMTKLPYTQDEYKMILKQ